MFRFNLWPAIHDANATIWSSCAGVLPDSGKSQSWWSDCCNAAWIAARDIGPLIWVYFPIFNSVSIYFMIYIYIFHDVYFMMYISQYIIVLVVSRGIIRDNVIVLVSQQRIVTRIHKENFSRTWFQFIPGRALLKMNNAHHDSLRLTDPCAVFICADSCEERTCRRGSSDQSAW